MLAVLSFAKSPLCLTCWLCRLAIRVRMYLLSIGKYWNVFWFKGKLHLSKACSYYHLGGLVSEQWSQHILPALFIAGVVAYSNFCNMFFFQPNFDSNQF